MVTYPYYNGYNIITHYYLIWVYYIIYTHFVALLFSAIYNRPGVTAMVSLPAGLTAVS